MTLATVTNSFELADELVIQEICRVEFDAPIADDQKRRCGVAGSAGGAAAT
jgi:hypothetical protein